MRVKYANRGYRTLRIFGVLLCLCLICGSLSAQISGTLQVPIVGYVIDESVHAIRPITGIPGNSRIGDPIDLAFPIFKAALLSDARHAIVQSPQFGEVLVVDLTDRSHANIAGLPSGVSSIRTSQDGTKAALYYAATNRVLVIGGLPDAPKAENVIDLPGLSPLTRFAVSNDGTAVLLSFRKDESDELYRWTPRGLSFVTKASAVSDLLFMDSDALFSDSGSNEVVMLRNIREQVSMIVVANAGDEIVQPLALSLSADKKIYIATTDFIFVLDALSHNLRKLPCDCTIATIAQLHDSVFRLTNDLYRPLMILDGRSGPERILFVPALYRSREVLP